MEAAFDVDDVATRPEPRAPHCKVREVILKFPVNELELPVAFVLGDQDFGVAVVG